MQLNSEILIAHELCTTQIDRCFGHDTAVEESARCLLAAKVEAKSALRGLAIVRIMGRSSGMLAMNAAMASGAAPLPASSIASLHILESFMQSSQEHSAQFAARRREELHLFQPMPG